MWGQGWCPYISPPLTTGQGLVRNSMPPDQHICPRGFNFLLPPLPTLASPVFLNIFFSLILLRVCFPLNNHLSSHYQPICLGPISDLLLHGGCTPASMSPFFLIFSYLSPLLQGLPLQRVDTTSALTSISRSPPSLPH